MGQSNGERRPRHSVGALGAATSQLSDILEEAARTGTHESVIAAFANIRARLHRDPHHFGEPLYHLRKLKMTVRCVAVIPLFVEYGVHDEQPVVVIRRVLYLTAGAA